VVALARHNRVQQVPERVGVLDRPYADLSLEGPERDLNCVTGGAAIPTGQAVGMLCPKLRRSVVARQVLRMLHRIDETRTTVPEICRASLV
jgi:hypothetical protein